MKKKNQAILLTLLLILSLLVQVAPSTVLSEGLSADEDTSITEAAADEESPQDDTLPGGGIDAVAEPPTETSVVAEAATETLPVEVQAPNDIPADTPATALEEFPAEDLKQKKDEEAEEAVNHSDLSPGLSETAGSLQNEAAARSGTPAITVSGPLTVKRSEIMARSFMNYDKWNLDEAWAAYGDYPLWKKSGIVDMLSKITINTSSIEPQNGDDWAWSRMHTAMGGGSTSFINKLSKVAVLVQKARKVPATLPLSAYQQLTAENTYIAPYQFQTDYSVDYSGYTPLFKNDFILIDDCRQISFDFAPSEDGQTHGEFTGEIQKLSLGAYQNVEVPNNVAGLIEGQSMQEAGATFPEYRLDDGWKIDKITDNSGSEYTEDTIRVLPIRESKTFTIHLKQNYKAVYVPSIWYPVNKDTGEVIPGLNPIHTVPEMYPRQELAVLNDATGDYEINLAAIPEPASPGTWTENNFNLTRSILFTDRFHRVIAQGYNTFDIKDVSSVVKIKYGTYEQTDIVNGIQGVSRTPFQAGETMHMYLCVQEGATLSDAEYKPEDVVITDQLNDAEVRQELVDHIKKVIYLDFDTFTSKELDLSTLSQLFLFRYSSADDGAFLEEGGVYKNFMSAGFSDLPEGKYEAVFPVYWGKDVPARFGSADEYIRNRYKLNDTFHFSFSIQKAAVTPAPILSAAPPVEKRVEGNPPAASVFNFEMRAVSYTAPSGETFSMTPEQMPMPDGAANGVKRVSVLGAGSVEFGDYAYSRAGTYRYELSEIPGTDPDYEYDLTKYSIIDTVVENEHVLSYTRVIQNAATGESVRTAQIVNIYKKSSITIPNQQNPTSPSPSRTIRTGSQPSSPSRTIRTGGQQIAGKSDIVKLPKTGAGTEVLCARLTLLLAGAAVLTILRIMKRK